MQYKTICLLLFIVLKSFGMKRTLDNAEQKWNDEKENVFFQLLDYEIPKEIFEKIVFESEKVPVLKEDYTENDVVQYFAELIGYKKYVNNLQIFQSVCKIWNVYVGLHRKKLIMPYRHECVRVHVPALPVILFGVKNEYFDMMSFPSVYAPHDSIMQQWLEYSQRVEPSLKYIFLYGWTKKLSKETLTMTLISSITIKDEKRIGVLIRFLLTTKRDAFSNFSNRNDNKKFTFRSIFSIIEEDAKNIEDFQRYLPIPLAMELMPTLYKETKGIKERCAELHTQGEYPDKINIEGSLTMITGDICKKGEEVTEVINVMVTPPLLPVGILDALRSPHFIEK